MVFNYESSGDEESAKKTAGPKSTTSYYKRRKGVASTTKSFKEFKPKAKPLEDPEKLHPRLAKARQEEKEQIEQENKKLDFPKPDMETQIEKLRRRVEKETKRRQIEEELKRKKKKQSVKANGSSFNAGNKPFTTSEQGKPLLIKQVNLKNLPNNEYNNTTQVALNDKVSRYDKIAGLEHLYAIPMDSGVKQNMANQNLLPKTEDGHVQEITALQPPPSEVLTLKAGVILSENGNVVNGPQADYQNRMSKDKYYNTLGSQSMQRK